MAEVEIEDEEFLSQVAALEAQALSTTAAKRRRISASITTTTTTTTNTVAATNTIKAEEGAYMAALKGSKSVVFQQKGSIFINTTPNNNNNNSYYKGGGISSSDITAGACFKCGKSGHWSRDCDVNNSNNNNNSNDDSVSFPEKKCACGLGNCLVLTANTEKNRGRKFYKCPVRQENGGCGFFEWCDQPTVIDTLTTRGQSYSANSSFPELLCPCGFGTCLVLTAKTGKNIGQQFYRCPSNQGSCGFFKWCNDNTTNASFSNPCNTSQTYPIMDGSTNKIQSSVTFSCFKCGNAGHWAKDCPQSSSQRSAGADGGAKYSNSSTCYKCGKPGHWAKDCSSN